MRDVYLVGAGQSPFGAFPDESYRDLFAEAYAAACDSVDHGIDTGDVDEAVVGTLGVGGRQLGLSGPAVTEHVGLHNVPCSRVENACAAGGFAVRQAVQAIKSGFADVAVAGGYEVMTDLSEDVTTYWLGVSGETEWERLTGTTFSGVYAQMASAYMNEYDATNEDLSRVAVKNHANGAKNPKAHLGFECSLEDAVEAPTVADPLTLYHCCPTSDGAAVAILASEDVVGEYSDERVRVAGVGAASERVGLAQRDSYTAISASQVAAETAYERAGVVPNDLDFAEVHDCFAIAELVAYEDLGFCAPGSAPDLLREGRADPDGDLPVNTSGGLKSKGHPIGATGTGQVVEAFEQLTGRADDRQLENPHCGLTHNVGGSGGASVVHVFEREGVTG
ncbi:thiolase domain-containing protein [Natronobacterium gregoryi]|uniref:3-ketoacyl-CoA thiolase n=2 Tax=Natronobacterium gregoryi TaxID=44930 RepID=L0AGD2_NATGS|nr:thiolase domain-containing protein [Natronobacterium gregoryi]AFZ72479.1 acetyl-CoA acetyltransferase [Natronobacterium gregoryi SP2]ELY74349.1 acetyl-CoA acetyltransferase [Natronobacterium gregoryi SP2]PLK21450.1 3-ketoacyl-CoA thiolase [Natronobacterium gregoryi SP2]SFI77521.1 acetyl-CoA C-acetyltransferase [Natronobacterium gregoryi]